MVTASLRREALSFLVRSIPVRSTVMVLLLSSNLIRMAAITDPLAQPQYTIALAAFGMGLGALCLYGTPFISLYLLSGRVYESVATVVSSWTGAMIGTGIEKYSAEAAASINRQAETTQYSAGYQPDVTRSGGQLEAGNLRAQGQRTAQLASIQAALTSQVAATTGAATTQRLIIQAAAGFQKSQVGADIGRSIRETNISRDQQVGTTIAGTEKDKVMAGCGDNLRSRLVVSRHAAARHHRPG